jgi:hypothetical protein
MRMGIIELVKEESWPKDLKDRRGLAAEAWEA